MFRPHAHEEFFIALTEAGRAASIYRRDTHAIGPGDIIVLNPEEAHAGGPPPGDSWAYRSLYLPPHLMGQLATEFPPGKPAMPRFAVDVVRDPRVAALLLRFHQLSERPGSSGLYREACLAEGLLLLTSRHAGFLRQPRPPERYGQPGSSWTPMPSAHDALSGATQTERPSTTIGAVEGFALSLGGSRGRVRHPWRRVRSPVVAFRLGHGINGEVSA
jgi:AraC-like ligand binding domain